MTTELVPFKEMSLMAEAVTKSGLFGLPTIEQALALMLVAQSEGMHPMTAIKQYHIIQGKPALKADAILARFQQAGGRVEWLELTNDKVVGKFSHEQGGELTLEWNMAMAHAAGITGNPTWKKYPRAMLRSRCISEGVRTIYPGVVTGTYTPEEVESFSAPQVSGSAPQVVNTVADTQVIDIQPEPAYTLDNFENDIDDLARIGDQAKLHEYCANNAGNIDTLTEVDKEKARSYFRQTVELMEETTGTDVPMFTDNEVTETAAEPVAKETKVVIDL